MKKYEISLSCPIFIKNLKYLKKKFHQIKADIEELFTSLGNGKKSGIPIPRFEGRVFKIRWPIKRANIGERKGLRCIYLKEEKTAGKAFGKIIPLILYYKGEKENADVEEVIRAIKGIETNEED